MEGILATVGTVVLMILIAVGLYGCPQYNVYSQRLSGEAELAKAEYSRQIAVREAQAKLDSASRLADAEIANKIIGDSLKGNDAYLRYLWINELGVTHNSVIYVPTEGNLPLLEAGRLGAKNAQ
jgi:predicted aminopeptidase